VCWLAGVNQSDTKQQRVLLIFVRLRLEKINISITTLANSLRVWFVKPFVQNESKQRVNWFTLSSGLVQFTCCYLISLLFVALI